jgi:hypothetical protein
MHASWHEHMDSKTGKKLKPSEDIHRYHATWIQKSITERTQERTIRLQILDLVERGEIEMARVRFDDSDWNSEYWKVYIEDEKDWP